MLEDSKAVIDIVIDVTIDARGLQCPMPLLRAKQALNKLQSAQVLEVFATDSGSYKDFQVFARQGKHELLLASESNNEYHYLIKKS